MYTKLSSSKANLEMSLLFVVKKQTFSPYFSSTTSDWEFYCANWEKGGVSPLGVGPNFAPQNGLKRNTDAEMVWIDWCFTSR